MFIPCSDVLTHSRVIVFVIPKMPGGCHGSNGSMPPLRQVPFDYRLPSWTTRSAFSGVEDDVSKAFVSRLQTTKNNW